MELHRKTFDEIDIGDNASRQVQITAEMIDRFAELSGDYSPIHIDSQIAHSRGFTDRIAHGFLTGALISSVIGMLLPGELGLLNDAQLYFRKPVYPDDVLTIHVEVVEKHDTFKLISLKITVLNQNEERVSTGKFQTSISK